jgi:2-polyprenyl-3-methyl-5-hydroxy-6-metoxy-1,4-benzoquinol methylase
MTPTTYGDKPGVYFDQARREIEPLLPARSARVLEVGCGTGATLQWLQQQGRCGRTVGIEIFESAAAVARGRVDEVHVGNAENLAAGLFEHASFDLVLCLDVLEHMQDPWAFVQQVHGLLKPGGTLIASIPNVRHVRVVLPLLLAGRWRYEESGILDATHLRFFTRASALALVSPPGMKVTQCLARLPPVMSKSGVANLLTLTLLRDLFTMGYLIAAQKDLPGA